MEEFAKDYLTGLLNRQGLYEWYHSLKGDCVLQFMFLDLDNFKMVNDTYGHNTGDDVLRAVAGILSESMEDVVCARLGGDEYVLVRQGELPREVMTDTAKDIIARIEQKKEFPHISTDVSASIGILLGEQCGHELQDILLKSDKAMYRAKSTGKSCYVVFNDIVDEVFEEMDIEQHQEEALKNGEFVIYYKPIISSQTSRLFISETFLVWERDGQKRRTQEQFYPLFEKNGFIRKLNMWLFEQACLHIQIYHERYHSKGCIGVRISRLLLLDKKMPERLPEVLRRYGVDAGEIYLGVQETAFSRNAGEILAAMAALKEKGFYIAVIDVGAEFYSMKYWGQLAFDAARFDAGYMQQALASPRGRQIVKTLLGMGRDLNMKVIVDGIRTKEEVNFLSGCGCNAIGGPYYSGPIPVREYLTYAVSKIKFGEQEVVFPFLHDYKSKDGAYEGTECGDGIRLDKGISDLWGSVYFPGGQPFENVLKLPCGIFSEDSYTVGMWVKAEKGEGWNSCLYARFVGGFLSYVSRLADGNSVFRLSEDSDVHGWHDIFARGLQLGKWFFVCLTYNAQTGDMRYFLNGRKCGYLVDVPILPNCRQIVLGGDPFQNSYEGYVSALTFFDHVKSEEEIAVWYQKFLNEKGFLGEKEEFWMEV